MKSLMFLLQMVLNELGTRCSVNSTSRDFKTATARVNHEGLSFLTITLPTLAKDLERVFRDGKVGHDFFVGFQLRGRLPLFLGGFFDLVIDRETGVLLDEPRRDAVFAIRQISLMFAKIALEPSEKKVRKALKQYVTIDADILQNSNSISAPDWARFLDSVVSYGHVYSLPSIERSSVVSSYLGMAPAPLLIGFLETESTNRLSGRSVWNVCFLMETTRYQTTALSIRELLLTDNTQTSIMLSWWNIMAPKRKDLLGS